MVLPACNQKSKYEFYVKLLKLREHMKIAHDLIRVLSLTKQNEIKRNSNTVRRKIFYSGKN